MLKIKYLLLTIILYLVSCNGIIPIENKNSDILHNDSFIVFQKKELNANFLKKIKSFKQFKYNVDNNSNKAIGFSLVQDDEALGIRGIILKDSFVYLSDPYFGNIKRINLNNGDLCISETLTTNRFFSIRNLAVFNNNIYVFTDKEDFYILNFDLKILSQNKIENGKGIKDIFQTKEDTLIIYFSQDIEQLYNKKINVSRAIILKDNNIKKDTVCFNNFEEYSEWESNVRGIFYKTIYKDGKHYLLNEYGQFEINENLPSTSEYYNSKSIDFNSNTIVYFKTLPTELIICVYSY